MTVLAVACSAEPARPHGLCEYDACTRRADLAVHVVFTRETAWVCDEHAGSVLEEAISVAGDAVYVTVSRAGAG